MKTLKSQKKPKEAAIRPALQERSARTRDAILEVVEQQILDGTFEQASVQDIVRAAGSSVGAFYGRFADKSAALYSFYEARCDRLEIETLKLLEPFEGDDLVIVLGRFIEYIVAHTLQNEAFLRASRPYFSGDEETPFLLRAKRLNSRLYAGLLPVLHRHRQEFRHPEPETAALFLLALVGGLTRDALLTGRKLTRRQMYAEAFVTELKKAVFGYLDVRIRD